MALVELDVDRAAVEAVLSNGQTFLAEVTSRVFADALRYCPVDTGELIASMRMRVDPGVGYVSVGTDHWMYPEYGTRAHVIRPRRVGGRLVFYWPRVGYVVSFKKVNHPGTPTVAYMRRALYQDRISLAELNPVPFVPAYSGPVTGIGGPTFSGNDAD